MRTWSASAVQTFVILASADLVKFILTSCVPTGFRFGSVELPTRVTIRLDRPDSLAIFSASLAFRRRCSADWRPSCWLPQVGSRGFFQSPGLSSGFLHIPQETVSYPPVFHRFMHSRMARFW